MKIIKIAIKTKMHSGGMSVEGDFSTVRPAIVCFSRLLIAITLFFLSTWWITCIYLSGMDQIFKIHGVLGTSRPLFRLIAPTRGRFGPRL